CVGGKGLARGYMNQEALTEAAFITHTFEGKSPVRLYRTGDLVRYLPDGNIEYIGRKDHQVKIRGFRIEIGEIEAALVDYPGVEDAVVVVREEEANVKRIASYLLTDQALDVKEVRQYIKSKLPTYM